MRWPWNRREARSSGLAQPETSLLEAFGTPTESGQKVTAAKATGLIPVYSAVSYIAEQIGQLPLKVYKDIGDGQRTEARQHRAWRLLHDKPNSETPAGRFWSTVCVHLLLWGNAFILKDRDAASGSVDELWLLHPSKMAVRWDPGRRVKSFEYRPGITDTAVERYSTSEVLHVFGMSDDGLVGLNVVDKARQALGVMLARQQFESGFYKRGAVLSGAVKVPGALSDAAAANLKASVNDIFGGSGKGFQIGVLEEGADYITLMMPLKDMEFVASQQLSRTDIATLFKLPPNLLGGSSGDSLTYATVEQNNLAFGMHAIAPLTHTIAQAVSQDPSIMPQTVFECEFVLDAMYRADTKARAEFYKTLHDMKAITANEIRGLENMEPLPGGDEFPEAPPQLQPPNQPLRLLNPPATDGTAEEAT